VKRKKGHGGVRLQLLEPTKEEHIYAEWCKCGCSEFKDIEHYYTHQHIELPNIQLEVSPFRLYKGKCNSCGREQKGYVPYYEAIRDKARSSKVNHVDETTWYKCG